MARQFVLLLCMAHGMIISGQQYFFSHTPFDPDLGEIKGNVLYIDSTNRLWVGTDKGLLLFDGFEFSREHLRVAAEPNVTSLYTDHQRLWIGSENGTLFSREQGGRQAHIDSIGGSIRAITEAASGVKWLATYGNGLLALRDSIFIPMADDLLPSKDIYAMVQDRKGFLWIGTDAGISVVHPGEGNDARLVSHLGVAEGLRDEIIMTLTESRDGMIWAGTFERGFCEIRDTHSIIFPFDAWSHGAILSMAAVDANEIWMSTEQSGVFRYDRRSARLTRVEMPGNATPVIIDMCTDNEGNLWLLDVYRGLYRTNRRFESYPVSLEGIQALLIDHQGTFYAGHPNGLYVLSEIDGTPSKKILSNVNVLSMYQDHFDNLWVGTFGQGLYCRPAGQSQWLRYTKENGLTDESILSIAGFGQMLWLATLGGVTRIEIREKPDPFLLKTTNYNLSDGLGTNFIYTVHVDARGRVWFGTDGKGLSMLSNGIIKNFQQADSIALHTVYSITEDVHGDICFITDRDGLFCFDGISFTPVELPLSLQDQEINNIVGDPHGNLLLAHSLGVDVVTPERDIVRFQESSTELLAPNVNAHFRDSLGTIWIAGQKKLLRYNPLSEAKRSYPHNIITSVKVYLEPVDLLRKHSFNANEDYLTFDFIGIWYTNPRDVIYRYRVEGLDPDWKETRERSVTYQNIPPGTYRFVLQSSCSGHYTPSNTIAYEFEIHKPFYLTTGFLIVSTLLTLLILYVILRARDRRIQREASLQRRQIESQLQTLKAQINPHFLFNSFNTLVSVIEEDPDAAVEYVENLSDFYRSILKYREKNLIPVREEIEIVKSYMYILQKRYGKGICMTVEENMPEVWVVPMVLQILVENAVKHNIISEKKPLKIQIRMRDENSIIVENSFQRKQVMGDSTGFGLQNISSRYTLLSDKPVSIGQTADTFYVIIPVLHKDEIPDFRR